MIDVIVVTHSNVAGHLIEAAERVLGKQQDLIGLNLHTDDSLINLTAKIADAIGQCCAQNPDQPIDGILVLTDLFGSTPTNASLAQIRRLNQPIEILTGVNLPMMISALTYRGKMNLKELAEKVMQDGQKGIRNAKSIFMSRVGTG